MTPQDRRKELERILPDKKDGGCICAWLKSTYEIDIWIDGYNRAIDESLIFLSDKVVLKKELNKIKQAIADYMATEGCSCCENIDGHNKAKEELALLLDVPKYNDSLGYNFSKFETK